MATTGDANPPGPAEAAQYYKNFYRPIVAQQAWQSSAEAITSLLAEGQGNCFSLAFTPAAQDQDGKSVDGPPIALAPNNFGEAVVFLNRNGISGDGPFRSVKDIAWFNLVRQRANLY